MNLRLKLCVDYYFGGFLHVILKPPTVLLGKLLRRNHDLTRCSSVTLIKMLGGGSLLIAYPALLAIRQCPNIRQLRLVTTPAVRPFAEMLGMFDEIIIIRDNSPANLLMDSFAAIRRVFRCDAIVDLEIHSRLTTVFALLACAQNRIGFYTSVSFWRTNLATHLLFCNVSSGMYYFYDQIAGLFGGSIPGPAVCRSAFLSSLGKPADMPAPAGRRIALAPCCSGLGRERMLTTEEWLQVLRGRVQDNRLAARTEIHLLGAPSDQDDLRQLADRIGAEFPGVVAVNHAGKTSLADSVRLLTHVEELFCIDSALLHFARLLGLPTISYWGPTDPQTRLRPGIATRDEVHYQKLPCSPCVHMAQEAPCRGNNLCMRVAVASGSGAECNPAWVVGDEREMEPRPGR
jgi:ADP-heptose:LPS heptosyltransferase